MMYQTSIYDVIATIVLPEKKNMELEFGFPGDEYYTGDAEEDITHIKEDVDEWLWTNFRRHSNWRFVKVQTGEDFFSSYRLRRNHAEEWNQILTKLERD